MTRRSTPFRLLLALLGVFALVVAACGDDDGDAGTGDDIEQSADVDAPDDATGDDTPAEDEATDQPVTEPEDEMDEPEDEMDEPATGFEGALVGTFAIEAGACADGAVTGGSYFRMLQAGGSVTDGPFIENFDSACGDTTYSLLVPGSDGGLMTVAHQAAPDPAFDADGNGLAASVVEPVTFFGLSFAAATDPTVDQVTITATDGVLSGSTASFTAYWAGAPFNQGAPKPDGTNPGVTSGPTGTIDPDTGAFVLEWASQIVGGSFNDFTGIWHLEGTFSAS